jgi:hypothetical protein
VRPKHPKQKATIIRIKMNCPILITAYNEMLVIIDPITIFSFAFDKKLFLGARYQPTHLIAPPNDTK